MPLFELFCSENNEKETKKMKAKTKIIAFLTMALLLFVAACGSTSADTPGQQPDTPGESSPPAVTLAENNPAASEQIGEGATTFRFEVTDGEGNVNTWTISTNETILGNALDEHEFVTRDDTGMVSHVNGIRADFFEDGAYWALFIGDDWAMEGIDTLIIEDGVTYAFVYTEA